MKRRIAVSMIALATIVFLASCGGLPTKGSIMGGAKHGAKKALTKPTVEILEVKMEKGTLNAEGYGELKVVGKAVYHPAKVGAKAFKDYMWDTKVEFYDAQGNKLPFDIHGLDYGKYGKAENVKPNEPFPFTGETSTDYIGKDNFLKASSCKVAYFTAIKM